MRRRYQIVEKDLQEAIAIGGAATRLRARGYSWSEVAVALGIVYTPRVKLCAVRYLLWAASQRERLPSSSPGRASGNGLNLLSPAEPFE